MNFPPILTSFLPDLNLRPGPTFTKETSYFPFPFFNFYKCILDLDSILSNLSVCESAFTFKLNIIRLKIHPTYVIKFFLNSSLYPS